MACKSTTSSSEAAARYCAGTAISRRSARRRRLRDRPWGVVARPVADRARLGAESRQEPAKHNSLAGLPAWGSVTGSDSGHRSFPMQAPHPTDSTSTASRRRAALGATRTGVGHPVLTTAEAAIELGVHERTVRRYLASGLLASRRLPGGHYRIPADALADFWDANDPSGGHLRPARPIDRMADSRPAIRKQRAPRTRRRLGYDLPGDYDLSMATLRSIRAQLS
jgi:excisionase family DNA binding protein